MNRPASYRPVTIADGVRSAGRRTPGKTALGVAGELRTYRQIVDGMDRVANGALHGLGLKPGSRTALFLPNAPEFVELVLGLSQAGLPPAIVPPNLTAPEMAYICNDIGAEVLFVHRDLEDIARSAALETVRTIIVVGKDYEDWRARATATPPGVAQEEWDVFIVSYTSGTTGKPKGCLLPHRSRVMGFYTMAAEYACYSPDDRSLAATPMYTGAGLSFALAPLFFGGYSEILPRFEAAAVAHHLKDNGITSTFLVPTQFEALFQLGDATPAPALKAIISGAAPLGAATKARILDRFGDDVFHELHGSNETGYVTNLRPADQRRKQHCVGLPYPAVDLRLLDDAGNEVAPGEVGEIFARSPMLFNGYWQRPEATAEAFRDGFASVGDMGRLDDEGYLYLVDRKKEMIKTGGSAVYPREVEDVLVQHPAVQDVAVFGVADPYWGEAVMAAVIVRPGVSCDDASLRAHCQASLARYKIPKTFHLVGDLPRNPGGKVMKHELQALAESGRLGGRTS